MAAELLTQPLDCRKVHDLVLDTADPTLAGPFDGDETFTVQIWTGDDQAAAAELTGVAAWLVQGESVRVTLLPADLEDLLPGTYRLRVKVAPDIAAWDGRIQLTAGPGTAFASPIYATADDLRRLVPWIEDLQSQADQAGFAEQLAMARRWLDEQIAARYWGDSAWIRAKLAAEALVVRDWVTQATACYAASLVLKHQVGNRSETSFQELGTNFEWEASKLARTHHAELITITGGTEVDLIVPLGVTMVLRG